MVQQTIKNSKGYEFSASLNTERKIILTITNPDGVEESFIIDSQSDFEYAIFHLNKLNHQLMMLSPMIL